MRFAVALIPLVAAALSGCGGGGADVSELENKPWQLVAGEGITLVEGAVPSAAFTEGSVFGSNGCNQYRGSYTVDGDSLEISGVASTLMACPPPRDEIGDAYNTALGNVASWAIEDDQLMLSDADGNELLRYEVASIEGEWTVTGVLSSSGDAFTSTIVGTEVTATFAEDGSLTGSSGCNNYTTSYTADAGEITIELPAGTKRFCPEPEGVMEQEAAYLAALEAAATYGFNGAAMELLDADGKRLVAYTRS